MSVYPSKGFNSNKEYSNRTGACFLILQDTLFLLGLPRMSFIIDVTKVIAGDLGSII